MTRRSLWLSVALVLVVLVGLGAAAYRTLTHVPAFYGQAGCVADAERKKVSQELGERLLNFFVNDIRYEADWHTSVGDQELNCWLAHDFVHSNLAEQLPEGIHEPRVEFRDDRILFGFRYGQGSLSAIVSIEARLWLPKREPNVIVMEFLSVRLGAMPLAIKVLQDELNVRARQQNVKVLWYRHDGHPTAVLKLQADRREPTIQLRSLEVRPGRLAIKGRSLEPALRNVPLPPARATP
jgi:hypothetical protein